MTKYVLIGVLVVGLLVGGIFWYRSRNKSKNNTHSATTGDTVKVPSVNYDTKQAQVRMNFGGTEFNVQITAGQNETQVVNSDYKYKVSSSTNMSPNTPTPTSPVNDTIVEFYKKDALIFTLSIDWVIHNFIITTPKA